MRDSKPQPERLTLTAAAELAGVSRATVLRRVRSGELEVARSAKDRRVRLVALEAVKKVFAEEPEVAA